MSSQPLQTLDALSAEEWEFLSGLVAEFEAAWRVQKAPQIDDFVAKCSPGLRQQVLVELIRVDQEFCWRSGTRRLVEHYLEQWPSLADSDLVLIDLIASECLTRAVFDNVPSYRELQSRFPNHCEHVPLARIRAEANHEHDRRAANQANVSRATTPVEQPWGKREMSLLQDGQIVRETYQVERALGEGAFAEVYRVKHRFLGRQAMKVFKIVGMTIEETEEMLGEALLLSRLGHPNIIRVFDANITETSRGICGFFTMEYVAGGSLEKFWQSHGAKLVPVETAVNVMTQVCRGLAVGHRETPPMVHRDIKPQNILVGYEADGLRARLSDFGLAKNVNPLTLLASSKGTPSFKAPEVFRDPHGDSCAADVWSVGATLHLLLTDRLPYANDNHPDQFDLSRFDRPLAPPSRLNVQVDDELEAIVLKSLAAKPEERYRNADGLLHDLANWKPKQQPVSVKSSKDWLASKDALGMASPVNEDEARKMVQQSLKLAKQTMRLMEAADLMEEAFNRWPGLRTDYQTQLQLWRRGISM